MSLGEFREAQEGNIRWQVDITGGDSLSQFGGCSPVLGPQVLAQGLVDSLLDPALLLDEHLQPMYYNSAFYELAGARKRVLERHIGGKKAYVISESTVRLRCTAAFVACPSRLAV